MNNTFDKFIAIDWSGAREPGGHIQVASCRPGHKPPILEPPMHWSRTDVLCWLVSQARKLRLMVGFDFAFAYPYCDQKAYFPGSDRSPRSVSDLWCAVEFICSAGEDMYGGSVYIDPGSPFHKYFRRRGHIGEHYRQERHRETERECALVTKPSSPFKCIGADQVGPGSAAGMRLLHAMEIFHHDLFSIWPFQCVAASKSVVVEIFPRFFFKRTGMSIRRGCFTEDTNLALSSLYSDKLQPGFEVRSEDERDSIVSVAALRRFCSGNSFWQPARMTETVRNHEGWIFGVE